MKKISTLYKKDPNDLGIVINEVNPENYWVFTDPGVKATHKRYDVKKGKSVPSGAIPCQDPDPVTGHWPHWVACDRNNPADHGTYELVGPKVQGNPEQFEVHTLAAHGAWDLGIDIQNTDFDGNKTIK